MRKITKKPAYAILDERGKMMVCDGRLPLYWMRKIAKAALENILAGKGTIVRVSVRVGD